MARNWRARRGEIDLVVADGETVVFVEVKARARAGFAPPAAGLDGRQRARIARAAEEFLAARGLGGRPCRFDLVSVTGGGAGRAPAVEHLVNVFGEGGALADGGEERGT